MAKAETLLSDDDVQRLIMSLAAGRGESGFTKDDVRRLVNWAETTRINSGLLECILAGELFVSNFKSDGEPLVTVAHPCRTAKGK